MGKRGRRKGSQGRAEDRVRGRVRERLQSRPGRREESSTRRRRGTFNVGAIEGYANRLTDHAGGTSGLAGAASGLAGAASGLAGGGFARRILENDTESSEEDFRNAKKGEKTSKSLRAGQILIAVHSGRDLILFALHFIANSAKLLSGRLRKYRLPSGSRKQ